MKTIIDNPTKARAAAIRKIFAEVCGRSFGGTLESTRIRRDLDLRGKDEDEISWRVEHQLGVLIDPIEWTHFSSIGDLVQYVEMEIQRRGGSDE